MHTLFTAAGIVILVSCATPVMVVSENLQSTGETLLVKGKDGTRIRQKLSFGDYTSTAIKCSWTKGFSSIKSIGFGTRGQEDWVNIIGTEYI